MAGSFTTKPRGFIRRGCKTVRARCIEFCETLQIKGYKQLPVDQAKDLFSQIIDHWDRSTLQAYFGTQAHRTIRKINRRKTYATGTVSNANIELSQDIKETKGYLEKLGLVHYERKGLSTKQTWFLVFESAILVPELVKTQKEEAVGVMPNDNFSLNLQAQANPNCGVVNPMARPMQLGSQHDDVERRRDQRERVIGCERNRSSESDLLFTPSLTEDENRVLGAAACTVPQKVERTHTQNRAEAA